MADRDREAFEVRDRALVARVAERDEAAFEVLWRLYHARVCALGRQMLEDDDEARAVAQEVFLDLWKRAPTDPPRENVAGWLFSAARHAALKRKQQRERAVSLAGDDARGAGDEGRAAPRIRAADLGLCAPGPMEDLESGRRRIAVRAAFSALPSEQQEALELHYFEGLTVPDAAERARVPIDTMKSRVKLAIEKMKLRLRAIAAAGRLRPAVAGERDTSS